MGIKEIKKFDIHGIPYFGSDTFFITKDNDLLIIYNHKGLKLGEINIYDFDGINHISLKNISLIKNGKIYHYNLDGSLNYKEGRNKKIGRYFINNRINKKIIIKTKTYIILKENKSLIIINPKGKITGEIEIRDFEGISRIDENHIYIKKNSIENIFDIDGIYSGHTSEKLKDNINLLVKF